MWCSAELAGRNFVLVCLVFTVIWDEVLFNNASGATQGRTGAIPRAGNSSQDKPEKEYRYINLTNKRRRNKGRGITNLSCLGISIHRYVSNGFCTSRKPVRDMICEGECMPMEDLAFFRDYRDKIFGRRKHEWHCVRDRERTKKVKVFCNDGSSTIYRIRVVRSCKCRKYDPQYNKTRFPMDKNK